MSDLSLPRYHFDFLLVLEERFELLLVKKQSDLLRVKYYLDARLVEQQSGSLLVEHHSGARLGEQAFGFLSMTVPLAFYPTHSRSGFLQVKQQSASLLW